MGQLYRGSLFDKVAVCLSGVPAGFAAQLDSTDAPIPLVACLHHDAPLGRPNAHAALPFYQSSVQRSNLKRMYPHHAFHCTLVVLSLKHLAPRYPCMHVRLGAPPTLKGATGCGLTIEQQEGSVRLVEGFGTPCDALYTGFVEVYHADEWGAICIDSFSAADTLAADVICRQLGFPHGTPVDPYTPVKKRDTPDFGALPPAAFGPAPVPAIAYSGSYYGYDYSDDVAEESDMPAGRFWLSDVRCNGPEKTLNDCNLGAGYRSANRGCQNNDVGRMAVACRQFAVAAAAEEVTTPGAGAAPSLDCKLLPCQCAAQSARVHLVRTIAPLVKCHQIPSRVRVVMGL